MKNNDNQIKLSDDKWSAIIAEYKKLNEKLDKLRLKIDQRKSQKA